VDEALAQSGAEVVYAASPLHTLHAVAAAAESHGAWSQTALEVPLTCATGLCHGCAVPVVGRAGVASTARACHDGPVLRGDRVRWTDLLDTVEAGETR
jgi:dihydroorotate dehydrogenase electron transfer subunit